MKTSFKHRKFENTLGSIAFLLAIFAALLGEPYRISEKLEETFKPLEFNGLKIDYIEPFQLAEWLMEKKLDLIVVDVRTLAKFNEYHIPSARDNSFLRKLVGTIPLDQILVVYSENNEHSIETWIELRQKGFQRVYLLDGGIGTWATKVLFPDLSQQQSLGEAEIEKIKKISMYFGGKPKMGEFYISKSRKKYHREGC